ncbi:hypothetical protein HYH03_009032 [Edaphochlamys debaryana]|uniref:Uncharacterized protein n=1 Tax=Edaphochlamys debaryana TaxID=47281 RepID=A0A835XYM2_9CHLO|nr:hypothetical protein HYH03_009032 [Edaphochlamys debaryana]|eukprot:KAG2492616.1 hypothetical protein HYH03_009032 [Edaphochlamys debaryana]
MFEREKEEGEETVAELVKASARGGLLHDGDLFFSDTRGEADASSDEEDQPPQRRGKQGKPRALTGPGGGDPDTDQPESLSDGAPPGEDDSDEDESSQEAEHGTKAEAEEGAEAERQRSSGGAGPAGRRGAGADHDSAPSQRRSGARAPVWSDPDDVTVAVAVASRARLRKLRTREGQETMDGTEYEAALRRQHAALNPRTSWASRAAAASRSGPGAAAEEGDEGADALLSRAGGLLAGGAGRRLPAGQLEATRLKDANVHGPSEAVVRAVRFHPNGQLLLTAGLDRKLRLFGADGLRNPLLQALHLDDLPPTDAAFAAAAPGGEAGHVVVAGRRPFFHLYDMEAGAVERVQGPAGCGLKSLERFAVAPCGAAAGGGSEPLVAFAGDGGLIPLVSLRSRQWVGSLRMSGSVRALAFDPSASELMTTGDDGVVHVWDLRMRRCRLALLDAGSTGDASALAASADGRWLATGSGSGVVNVYARAEVEAAAARAGGAGRVAVEPAKSLMNLTTNADTLVFSPDSQMLAAASRMKRDALRLVHLPSLTVFANWPTSRSPLHYVHSLDFSPHCGLLAIGNAKGRALLYRLHHYQQA